MAFKPPLEMNFREPATWQLWKDRFSRFRLATELDKKDGIIQVSSLLYAMGAEADRIFAQFTFANEGQKKDFDIVLKKFDDHFVPARNVIHERATFHRRDQRAGETVEQYVRSLYDLAEHANFTQKEETIRDRLVLGLADKELSEKLQLQADLTLQNAVATARQHERVKHEIAQQRGAEGSVDRVQQNRRWKTSGPGPKQTRTSEVSCGKCGTSHQVGKCPAKGKKCHKCGKQLSCFCVQCHAPWIINGFD